MTSNSVIWVVLLSALVVSLVSSQSSKHLIDTTNDFDSVDQNKNGEISMSEFLKWRGNEEQSKSIKLFKSYDSNIDGHLSVNEFVPLVYSLSRSAATESELLFSRLDANNDGVLTREEARFSKERIPDEITTGLFLVADTNGDGKISLQEFNTVVLSTETLPHNPQQDVAQSLLASMDVNNDQHISRTELRRFIHTFNKIDDSEIDAAFAVIDTDRNGVLSVEELNRVPSKITDLAGIRPMPSISQN